MDQWDVAATGPMSTPSLARLAMSYLTARRDHALGIAPTRLLRPRSAERWLLFWAAARRVDDAVEAGASTPEDWRRRLDAGGSAATFAGRCVERLVCSWTDERVDIVHELRQSLKGLEAEGRFDRPRPESDYFRLLAKKSRPAMRILDALLFPEADPELLEQHASAFADSTQVGDDCRDAERDLKGGRCFVTREELEGAEPEAHVRKARFAAERTTAARGFLDRADRAAVRLRSASSRRRAQRLSLAWRYALDTGQIRPTRRHLVLPPA